MQKQTTTLGGIVEYTPNFLDKDFAKKLQTHLLSNNITWVQETYKMFGKPVKTPRVLTSMMDKKFKTRMTGTVWNENTEWVKVASDWTPLMNQLKTKLENHTGRKFQYCQMNHYRTSEDYIGWHSDSENQPDDVIASISLGASRRFLLRDRKLKKGPAEYEYLLENGSLLVFDNDVSNKKYKHTIPKVRKCDNYSDPDKLGRINITFREH